MLFVYLLPVLIVLFFLTFKVIDQYERGVILTLWRYQTTMQPWLKIIIPLIQRIIKVDIREKAVDVPSQEAMTKDNISCSINAVLYYRIKESEAEKAILNVQYVDYAMSQFAQTTMRNVVWQFELDELLSNRQAASSKIREIVDEKSDEWWVEVKSVELKDINLPNDLKRTIWKQAEAEREKRAKIITAEWELQASENLKKAAEMMAMTPWALHLRTLQSINDMSSDQSNTVVWMVPVEVLEAIRWFKKE